MNYAIIQTGGKQYQVTKGEELLVDKIRGEKDEKIKFSDVLLVKTDEKIIIGEPLIPGAYLTAKIIDQVRGEKITISKFKAKVHYRRKIGFRPQYTQVLIEEIKLK